MNKFLPLIFVLLWSSAFVTTKPIVDNSDPFAALAFRFFIVALGFFIYCVYKNLSLQLNRRDFIQSFSSGVLFHGIYLGGVFFSISKGIPTGITALIVTMQPILTNALAGPFLKEYVGWKQWIGVVLGFIGSALVLGVDIGGTLPTIGIIAYFIALISITSATLFQKKFSGNIPLPVSNTYQAAGGCFFHLIVILFFSTFLNLLSGPS